MSPGYDMTPLLGWSAPISLEIKAVHPKLRNIFRYLSKVTLHPLLAARVVVYFRQFQF